MATALFFNTPAHGHVNPSLPLVEELVRRGDRILYYMTESYRTRITATGAEFQPYATIHDDYFESHGLDGSTPLRTAETLINTTRDILPELVEIARTEQPDYVLFDCMCPWGALLPRIIGVPAVSSMALLALTPGMIFTSPMIRQMLPHMIRDIGRVQGALATSNAIGSAYRIPPLKYPELLMAFGDLTLSYTSRAFQPGAASVDSSVRFVGPLIQPRPHDPVFPFDQLDDKPLIYISLGTVINNNPAFFRRCIQAFGGSDYQVVMSIGERIEISALGEIPPNFIVSRFVPQLEILERAALFITHAGLNSVHEGLWYNVPLLLVPQQAEQSITAKRVVDLKAGLMLRNRGDVPIVDLVEAARALIMLPHFKAGAARLGESLRNAGGVRYAADEIDLLLKRK